MKIDISFTSIKHYNWKNIHYWIWYFKTYKFVKAFIIRIFGVYINVREQSATQNLIAKGLKKFRTPS